MVLVRTRRGEHKLGLEENKAIAQRFLQSYVSPTFEDAVAMMNDSFVFTLMMRNEAEGANVPTQSKSEFTSALAGLAASYPAGFQMTVTSMIAEGDLVAAEGECSAYMEDGSHYNNLYHFLVEVKDGGIGRVKEYCDIQHALDTGFLRQ